MSKTKTLHFKLDDHSITSGKTDPVAALLIAGLQKQAAGIKEHEDRKGTHGRLVSSHLKSLTDTDEVLVKEDAEIVARNAVIAKVNLALTFVKDETTKGGSPGFKGVKDRADKEAAKKDGAPENKQKENDDKDDAGNDAAQDALQDAVENAAQNKLEKATRDMMHELNPAQIHQLQMDAAQQIQHFTQLDQAVNWGVTMMQVNPFNTQFRADVGQFLSDLSAHPALTPVERALAFAGAEAMADPNFLNLNPAPVPGVSTEATPPVVPLSFPPALPASPLDNAATASQTNNAIPQLIGNFMANEAMATDGASMALAGMAGLPLNILRDSLQPAEPAAGVVQHTHAVQTQTRTVSAPGLIGGNPFAMAPTPNMNDPAFGGSGVSAGSAADTSGGGGFSSN